MNPIPRKLVLSLSQALAEITAGSLSEPDLATALFCLSATKNWPRSYSDRSSAHSKLGAAITAAVAEERIEFLNDDYGDGVGNACAWERFNAFLQRHGYKQVRIYPAEGHVDYTQTEAAVRLRKQPLLKAVYRRGG